MKQNNTTYQNYKCTKLKLTSYANQIITTNYLNYNTTSCIYYLAINKNQIILLREGALPKNRPGIFAPQSYRKLLRKLTSNNFAGQVCQAYRVNRFNEQAEIDTYLG